jgi:hypothetical protein
MLNYWCDDTFTFSQMTRDEFSVCNAAEGGDAAASVIDNSAAYGNPVKSFDEIRICYRTDYSYIQNPCENQVYMEVLYGILGKYEGLADGPAVAGANGKSRNM